LRTLRSLRARGNLKVALHGMRGMRGRFAARPIFLYAYSIMAPDEALLDTIAAFDRSFATDQGAALGDFFTTDGCLMWPDLPDIKGREAIRAAFEQFVATFTTIAFQPDRRLLEQHEDNAYSLGRFIEVRRRLDNGQIEQVHGRLVEVWRREEDGRWRIEQLLTGRFAETVVLGHE
jgi:ketosteroid isomerase-like protein